jgi:hypothetical protein
MPESPASERYWIVSARDGNPLVVNEREYASRRVIREPLKELADGEFLRSAHAPQYGLKRYVFQGIIGNPKGAEVLFG